ncbi:hypothetical protein K437DRAFT_255320 [Tilletiaria anomala UBC 951]|uniref:Uncharacterized protein n=1 Tax=Tilletiaria anomala (strain ATCC 24038 / CBS 436.72 / UBC 951) TaxID=1037660 RepID=A0A066W621_TILAU|nr:uncharacterized protein K437DRAFT_255320 [Tilletiaria anomala UBC 951]KDN49196.1 hypothetical protein K437DRAFT_255320 [Tilletiaria anomala UBC 951]
MADQFNLDYLYSLTESNDPVPDAASTRSFGARTADKQGGTQQGRRAWQRRLRPDDQQHGHTSTKSNHSSAFFGATGHHNKHVVGSPGAAYSAQLTASLMSRPYTAPLSVLVTAWSSLYLAILWLYFSLIFALCFKIAWHSILRKPSHLFRKLKLYGSERSALSESSSSAAIDALHDKRTSAQIREIAFERSGEVLLWLGLAVLSLGTTWYHMIRYLLWSYQTFLHKAKLAQLLPPVRHAADARAGATLSPSSTLSTHITHAVHLSQTTLERMHVWLRETSLFKEAWLLVVGNELNWWWSAEVCIFTVGVWALFLRQRGGRSSIPSVWAFMLLGQVVAISFAQNLFHLALVLAPPESGRISISCSSVSAKEDDMELVRAISTNTDEVLRLYTETTEVECEQIDNTMSATGRSSRSDTIGTTNTTRRIWKQTRAITPPSIGRTLDVLVIAPVLVFAVRAVWFVPSTLPRILIMHLFPLLLSLYPTFAGGLLARLRSKLRIYIEHVMPTRHLLALSMLAQPSAVYALLALAAAIMRIANTYAAYGVLKISLQHVTGLQSARPGIRMLCGALFQRTFFSHPAQSSISFDNVCIGISSAAWIMIDMSRNMDKSRSARSARGAGEEQRSSLLFNLAFESAVVALITIIAGPSVTMAAYVAVDEHRREQSMLAAEKRLIVAGATPDAPSARSTTVSCSRPRTAQSDLKERARYILVNEVIEETIVRSNPGRVRR